MSVIPFGAVLETATTGTFACCASGSAAVAVLESVGPMMAATRSLLMKRWNTAMPCSFVEASSSMTASSLTSFSAPLLLMLLDGGEDAGLLVRAVGGGGAGHAERGADLDGVLGRGAARAERERRDHE